MFYIDFFFGGGEVRSTFRSLHHPYPIEEEERQKT